MPATPTDPGDPRRPLDGSTPSYPDVPLSGTPDPSAHSSAPSPDLPSPDLPSPDVPSPDLPSPDQPGLDLSALGGFDVQGLLAQAQQMQQQLASAQEELAQARIVGTSGGGLVTATVSGTGSLLDLSIDPAALDPADTDLADTVADLVLAAVRDAEESVRQRAEESLGPLAGGLGGLPGLPGG